MALFALPCLLFHRSRPSALTRKCCQSKPENAAATQKPGPTFQQGLAPSILLLQRYEKKLTHPCLSAELTNYGELQEEMQVTSLEGSYIAQNQKLRGKTHHQVIFVKQQMKPLNKCLFFSV